jgi:molecular chaperone HscA
MNLIEISEPPIKQALNSDEIAIGIDLGTSNSVVACLLNGKPEVLGPILPSVYRNIRSIKRLMGSSERVDDLTPIEVSSYILAQLKQQAESCLSKEITKAVITVPAHFDDTARNATKAAAKLAGLEVLRLINEPTAAAIAYGLDYNVEGNYLIYDFGGGTFDVSVLRMQKGVFQVLATGGDLRLGGDDIDSKLMETLNLEDPLSAKEIKEKLSSVDSLNLEQGSISREACEQIIRPFIDKTIAICQETIKQSKINPLSIKELVLVGGSTRIPLVKRMVGEAIKPALDNIDPDLVVAIGAAIQADALVHGSNHLLLDVASLSIGLEVMGGMNEIIIHKNSTIPISITKHFTTYQDGQTGMIFHIVQGERDMVNDCRSLAKFELKGIPPMKASLAKVAVTFTVDVDGLLTVTAKEEVSNIKQEIEIKPSYGLTEAEIESMLEKAYRNAKEDMEAKELALATLKAKGNITHLSQAIIEDADLLEEAEKEKIVMMISDLQAELDSGDALRINQANSKLETNSSNFIKNRLNRKIKLALQGKLTNEF